jgi:hypothetical protein
MCATRSHGALLSNGENDGKGVPCATTAMQKATAAPRVSWLCAPSRSRPALCVCVPAAVIAPVRGDVPFRWATVRPHTHAMPDVAFVGGRRQPERTSSYVTVKVRHHTHLTSSLHTANCWLTQTSTQTRHSVVLSIKQHERSLADPNTVPVYTPVPIKDCRQATPAPSGPTVPRLLQAPPHKPPRPRPSRRQLYNFILSMFLHDNRT